MAEDLGIIMPIIPYRYGRLKKLYYIQKYQKQLVTPNTCMVLIAAEEIKLVCQAEPFV